MKTSHRRPPVVQQLPQGLIEAVRIELPAYRGRRTMVQLAEVLMMSSRVRACCDDSDVVQVAVERVLLTSDFDPNDYLDTSSGRGRHRAGRSR